MARDLWIASDVSYKTALQLWQAKQVSRQMMEDEMAPPDWSPAEPVVSLDLSPPEPIIEAPLKDLSRAASKTLWEVGGLDIGEVKVNATKSRYYLATSEGTRLTQKTGYTVVYALASVLRDDGVTVYDQLRWVVRDQDDLPPAKEIVASVRELGRNVLARVEPEPVDYYEGPVIFEGRAAAQFFRSLLPLQLSGTPPAPMWGVSYRQLMRRGSRLGRRLLPRGWSVVDDPSRALEGLAGSYVYDREGVKGEKVVLVEDGYVRDLLMSRVPRADKRRSNGHARGSIVREWEARLSVWSVEAPEYLEDRAFARTAELARERAQQDRVLVVYRLHHGIPGTLPGPSHAVWRFADGHEEPVVSLEFQGVDRRTLRSIVAAGGGRQLYPYLSGWALGEGGSEDRGLDCVLEAPWRLIVDDLELVFPGANSEPRALSRPPRPSAE